MSVLVYAICESDADAPLCRGVGGQPLRIVRDAGLAALVSDAPADVPGGGEQELWEHEQAVEALMAEHDVLPARFGTSVSGEEEARGLLSERAAEFRRGLARVAGSFELAIRASLAKPSGSGPARSLAESPGSSYMHALKAREDLAKELDRRIALALGPLSRASRSTRPRGAPETVASAHLVERRRLGEFRDRAAQLAEEVDFAEVFCTGPWPPYSFSEDEGAP